MFESSDAVLKLQKRMRPPQQKPIGEADVRQLVNEALILRELYEVTGQGRVEASRADIRAQWAEDAANGYMPPGRARWYMNLRPLEIAEPFSDEGVGVDPFQTEH